eukprot:gene1247-11336_t
MDNSTGDTNTTEIEKNSENSIENVEQEENETSNKEETNEKLNSATDENVQKEEAENNEEEKKTEVKRKTNLGKFFKNRGSGGGSEDETMSIPVPSTPLSDLLKRSKQKTMEEKKPVKVDSKTIEEIDLEEKVHEKYLYYKTPIENTEIFTFNEKLNCIETEECQTSNIQVQDEIIEPFVKDCLHLFSGKWNVLVHKNNTNFIEKEQVRDIDDHHINNFKKTSFIKKEKYEPIYELKESHPNNVNDLTKYIFLKFHSLYFQLGYNEPLVCNIEIIDTHNQKKLSEKFSFQIDPFDVINDYYEDYDIKQKKLKNQPNQPRVIIPFSEQPNVNIFVLLTINKILQAPVETVIKQYKKLTDPQKIRDQIQPNQEYQQTFLWGFQPLFIHEENKIKLNEGILSFEYFYPLDLTKGIDFYSLISNSGSKDGSLKGKQKTNFNGYLLYEVEEFVPLKFENDDLTKLIITSQKRKSTNLNNYKLEEAQQIIDKMNIKSLDEFKLKVEEGKEKIEIDSKYYLKFLCDEFLYSTPKSPFFTFVHELFIYPKYLNFQNLKLEGDSKSIKPRNILIEIKLVSDSTNGIEYLKQFVHISTEGDHNEIQLKEEYKCFVTMNQPTPYFIDCVKLILPIPIHQYHYLLFNYYHLNEEKKKKEFQRVFIGSSVLPLSHIIEPQEKDHSLQILKQIPKIFFKYEDDAAFNFQKHYFNLQTKLQSTIYPQESSISKFFRECSPFLNVIDPNKKQNLGFVATTVTAANNALSEIQSVDIKKLISHYPLLLDLMFSIMCRAPDIMNNFINSKDVESNFSNLIGGGGGISIGRNNASSSNENGGENVDSPVPRNNRRQSMKIEFDPTSLGLNNNTNNNDPKKKGKRGSISLFGGAGNGNDKSRNSRDISKMEQNALPDTFSSKVKKRLSFAIPQKKQRESMEVIKKKNSAIDFDLKTYIKNQEPTRDRKSSLGQKFKEIFKGDRKDSSGETRDFTEQEKREERKSLGVGTNTLIGNNNQEQFVDFFALNQSIFDLQKKTFEALISLLRGACDHFGATGRTNSLLSSYVSHVFNDVIMTKSPVCLVLTERWTELLNSSLDSGIGQGSKGSENEKGNEKKFNRRMSLSALVHNQMNDDMELYMHTLNFSWFLFDIIYKSFILLDVKDGGYSFVGLLKELMQSIADKVILLKDDDYNKVMSNYVNQQVLIFLNNISNNLKPTYFFDLFESYYNTIHKNYLKEIEKLKEFNNDENEKNNEIEFMNLRESIANSLLLKQEILIYFFENSQILSLNNPLYFQLKDSNSISRPPFKLFISILNQTINYYFDIKDVMPEDNKIDGTLLNVTKNLIFQSIDPLYHLLHKIDLNEKCQNENEKKLISRILFPFLILFLNRIFDLLDIFKEREQSETLKKFLKCFVFILKDLDEQVYSDWIKNLYPIELFKLFKIFHLILNSFLFSEEERKQMFINSQQSTFETIYAYKTMIQVLEERLSIFFKIWESKIFEEEESIHTTITDVFESKDSTLLDHFLVILSLIIKRQLDLSIQPSQRFIQILQELVQKDFESVYHLRWMYSSILQGVSFGSSKRSSQNSSDSDLDNTFLKLLISFQEQISYPPPSTTVAFETLENEIEKDPNSGEIKAGTVDVLIEKLTNEKDPKYTQQFFLTYRSFMTPYELMDQIAQRYLYIQRLQAKFTEKAIKENTEPKENLQYKLTLLRILNNFKLWLNDFYYDFDNALVVMLVEFLRKSEQYVPCNQIKSKLEKKLLGTEKDATQTTFSKEADPSIIPKDLKSSTVFVFTQWDPLEIARQITLIEYSIFRKITPKECFNLSWTKKNKEQTSPNIVELTKRFNDLSYWFATLIVKEEDLKSRIKVLSHVVKVITACQSINNFNAVTTINGALNNAAIHRLKKTFDGLSKEERKKLQETNELVSNTGSYKLMRDALANSAPPTIPYLGVFLTDLTFIEEGATDTTKVGLINFGKRRLFADVLLKIQLLQQQPYHFTPIPLVQKTFTDFEDLWDDSTLFKQSRKIEPKQ